MHQTVHSCPVMLSFVGLMNGYRGAEGEKKATVLTRNVIGIRKVTPFGFGLDAATLLEGGEGVKGWNGKCIQDKTKKGSRKQDKTKKQWNSR